MFDNVLKSIALDANEWTLRIIGMTAMIVGLLLVILYIRSEKKRTGCNNSAPVPVPLKFVKVDVPLQVICFIALTFAFGCSKSKV